MRDSAPRIDAGLRESFVRTGRDLFLTGAVSSHGGNMSVRRGDRIFITRTGSMLGRIGEHDVVWTRMGECELDEACSREIVVHRAIYAATDARAIVHAHPAHTIFRSIVDSAIEPIDSEGAHVLGASVPVLTQVKHYCSVKQRDSDEYFLQDGRVFTKGGPEVENPPQWLLDHIEKQPQEWKVRFGFAEPATSFVTAIDAEMPKHPDALDTAELLDIIKGLKAEVDRLKAEKPKRAYKKRKPRKAASVTTETTVDPPASAEAA